MSTDAARGRDAAAAPAPGGPPDLRAALVVSVVGLAAFVALAAWLVPWHPVPGGSPPPASVSEVLSPAQVDRAEAYSAWARVWGWSSLAVSLAVAAWLGFGRRGRAAVERLPGPWWLRLVVAVLALEVVGRVATLPLRVAGRRLALDAGLTTQSWGAWTVDLVRGTVVTTLLTTVALLAVVACARRWRRAWPAVAGLLAAALVMGGSFLWPVVVEPLSNDFRSLPAGQLRTDVLMLAAAEGVRVDDVLVADASRRTTTLNAYVSGFGSTRRVVLYDNLVDDVPERQVLVVVAHELAHARNDDVLVGSALGAAGSAAGVGLLALVVGGLARRRGSEGVADVGSVPLVLAVVALASFLVLPVQNGISRAIETRADVVALETTRDPEAFVAVERQLALRSLADPTPPVWSQWWFGSHPTVLERVALADRVG